jgi:hypothetical protein
MINFMGAGAIVLVAIAAGICGLIAVGGWTFVRRLEGDSEKHREEKEMRKARKVAQRTADLEEPLKRQQEARRGQRDQHGR